MEKIVGIIEEIENIKELKQGRGKKGAWTLWGSGLLVDGQRYGLADFDKTNLENRIKFLALRDKIEFEVEQKRNYLNVRDGSVMTVLSHANAPIQKAPAIPQPVLAQKTLADFSVVEIAKQAIPVAEALWPGPQSTELVLKARLTAFEQLMLDRRTIMIQKFKRGD